MTIQNSSYLKNLYCFRHCETAWNKEKRLQGKSDIPLNSQGRSQALSLAPIASRLGIEFIYSSPLIRAVETARIIAHHLKVEIALEHDLAEIDLGLASGVVLSEIDLKFGDGALTKWKSDCPADDDFYFPNGETKNDLRKRTLKTFSNISHSSPKQNIGIVTHGFVLKQMLITLGIKNHDGLKNGAIVHFTYNIREKKLDFIERISDGF